MAEHGSSGTPGHGFEDHKHAYEGFVKGAIVMTLMCFLVLVSLVAFRFASNWNVLLGFAGLIIGTIAVLIDARAGSRWFLSLGVLVVFGLITAVAVS